MATFQLLSIFFITTSLVIGVLGTTSSTPAPVPQCFIPGECTSSALVGAEPAVDVNNCLQLCKDSPDCAWFTFVPYAMFCELFSECAVLSIDNCANCISGEKVCEAPKCDVIGLCQVRSNLKYDFRLGFWMLDFRFPIFRIRISEFR